MRATRTGIAADEALRSVLAEAAPLPAELVEAGAALGRVLAAPVAARRTLPPADCSAMDGYALRAADLAEAGPGRAVCLRVGGEVAAGGRAAPLAPGEAARIFTGAPLPQGADAVVPQEQAEALAATGEVRIAVAAPPGAHIRRAGEDVRAGDEVLPAGARLGPGQIGMLAALGRTLAAVHRRPRVALLSSGDELVEPDGDASGGRIVSSNAYALAAQCREAGALPINLGIARDNPAALTALLRAGLEADLLVSTAGVSVGDHDHVRPALAALGCRLVFWGVRVKPGYPVAFGVFDGAAADGAPGDTGAAAAGAPGDTGAAAAGAAPSADAAGAAGAAPGRRGPLVFALPGNPVSAMVSFEQLVRPVLLRMGGHRKLSRPVLRAELGETLRKSAGRLHYVRVQLSREGGRIVARSTGNQSSGALHSMTLADGLLIFPEAATELPKGSEARVQLLDPGILCEPA